MRGLWLCFSPFEGCFRSCVLLIAHVLPLILPGSYSFWSRLVWVNCPRLAWANYHLAVIFTGTTGVGPLWCSEPSGADKNRHMKALFSIARPRRRLMKKPEGSGSGEKSAPHAAYRHCDRIHGPQAAFRCTISCAGDAGNVEYLSDRAQPGTSRHPGQHGTRTRLR